VRDAALMNGVLVHGLDFDDTHLEGVVHASASCWPAALGMAWRGARSGADLLLAYIVGMEVAARLGAVAKGEMNQLGFHPTGVVAAFACALVAGRLQGLDAEALVNAQGIALSMAAGTREYSSNGAMTKRLHPGWAAVCGITAAQLARAGYTGPLTTYEGEFGLYATHLSRDRGRWDLAAATRALGDTWETAQVAIKPHPACQLSIACIDAAIAVGRDPAFSAGDVERIEAVVPPHAVKIVCEPLAERRRPANAYAAQFSIPFAVACGLLHGRCGLAELERYRDPALLALAAKVGYRVDPDTNYPQHFSGEVIVMLKDGRRLAHREPINRGAADHPVSDAGIVAKFRDNARLAATPEHIDRVAQAILGLEACADARDLARLLEQTGREVA
jgi:2-methylcitrate dehydratase PrpD